MGKALVVCAFALTLVGGTSAAFYSRGSGSAQPTTRKVVLSSYQKLDYPNAMTTGAFGINIHGQIVGLFEDQNRKQHGFLRDNGVFSLKDVPGADETNARGINDNGAIVFFHTDDDGIQHGSVSQDGITFFPIDYLEAGTVHSGPHTINNSNQIVGFFQKADGLVHGYLLNLKSGSFTPIDYPRALHTDAFGINNVGQIVGVFIDRENQLRSFLKIGQEYTEIDFPDDLRPAAYSINDNGWIVGDFPDNTGRLHGYVLIDGFFTQIDIPSMDTTNTSIYGINNLNQIVGGFVDGDGVHGFVGQLVLVESTNVY
jgi:probable HAF family extracellular repeat protein